MEPGKGLQRCLKQNESLESWNSKKKILRVRPPKFRNAIIPGFFLTKDLLSAGFSRRLKNCPVDMRPICRSLCKKDAFTPVISFHVTIKLRSN